MKEASAVQLQILINVLFNDDAIYFWQSHLVSSYKNNVLDSKKNSDTI